ncbi:unnamed protein product [Symbiodinium sp. CCMP2592]|nr:unnamed protein product [Symbiodinium sp. CCMP2592]
MQTESEEALQTRRDLEAVWGGTQTWAAQQEKEKEKEQEKAAEAGTDKRDGDADQDRPQKWRKGPSTSSWEGWDNRGKRPWQGQDKPQKEAAESEQTQELIKCLVKMTVRHEQELMRIRPDVGFIGFCDTTEMGCIPLLKQVSENWADLHSKGQVTTGLKTILERMQRCLNVGWALQSECALNPAWVYHTWDAKEKKQVVSTDPPLKHAEALRLIDVLIEDLAKEGVLTRFGSTKQQILQEKPTTEVIPMMLQLSLRGQASDLCYDAMKKLSGNAIVKLQGVRWRPERAHKPPLAMALEEAYLAVPYCDWSRRDHQGSWDLTPFPARLVNRTGLCYANSTLQALLWLSEISGTDFGQLQQGRRLLRTNQAICLPDCLSLRRLFAGWMRLHQQHDAGEFLAHCLHTAQAEAWEGGWQARLENPDNITDSGTLLQAIPLHLPGANPQALVDKWHGQFSRHALTHHSGLVFLQLCRYTEGADKDKSVLRVRPGDSIVLPIFTQAVGLTARHETFQVAVIIYHLGETSTSGHYLTLLGVRQSDRWDYYVSDDNRPPRKAKSRDLQLVDHNAYLIGLMRSL